jgi:hypothetical protein
MKKTALMLATILAAAPLWAADPAAPARTGDSSLPPMENPAPVTPAQEKTMAAVRVDKIETAQGVENREPLNPSSAFDNATERVYCWTRITADSTPAVIKHIWYHNNEKVAEVPLNINNSPARTWSYKTVRPGPWKVEVAGEDGMVLATREFTVGLQVEDPSTTTPAAPETR